MNSKRFSWIALLISIVALVVAIAVGGDMSTTVKRVGLPPIVVKQGQQAAVAEANRTPTTVCNPPLGAGTLGTCAPRVPFNPLLGARKVIGGTLGVDVSSYQGCTNTFSGVSFVITKFNESTGYRDKCASHNIYTARVKHLAHGGYDFLRPGSSSAAAEANVFVSMYRSTGATGVAVADVEANGHGLSRSAMVAYVCGWVHTVHSALPNAPIAIYTGGWFWNPQVGGQACNSVLWVSAYANSYSVPAGFTHATIWQYSDGVYGPVPHINGWDSDVFLGSKKEFEQVFALIPPIPGWAKLECRELNKLRQKAAAIHKKTGKYLSKKDHDRRVKLHDTLAQGHFSCANNGQIRRTK